MPLFFSLSRDKPVTRQNLELLLSSTARRRSPILCLMIFWLTLSIVHSHKNGVPTRFQGHTVICNGTIWVS